MKFSLSINTLIRLLITIAVLLLFFDLVVNAIKIWTGYDYMLGIMPLFDLYEESNIPTWFSSILLFSASLLLVVITMIKKELNSKEKTYWGGLAAIFVLLSLDEIAQLHELSGKILGMFGRGTGIFYNMWVIVAGVVLVVFAALYFKFWWSLPQPTKKLFLIAALIYIGGAVGFEMLESLVHGSAMAKYINPLFVAIEESMEMGGIILFIYTLLRYIKSNGNTLQLSVK